VIQSANHPGHPVTLAIPEVETERLRLRLPSEADVAAIAEFYDSDRAEGVGGRLPRDKVWRVFATMVGHWVVRGYGMWAIEERSTGRYCGWAGLWFPEGWPEREIGWALMAHAEGRGLAHEAALAARDHAYTVLGWRTAISLVLPDNKRSISLAERLGARFEADYVHPSHGSMRIYRHPAPEALQ